MEVQRIHKIGKVNANYRVNYRSIGRYESASLGVNVSFHDIVDFAAEIVFHAKTEPSSQFHANLNCELSERSSQSFSRSVASRSRPYFSSERIDRS